MIAYRSLFAMGTRMEIVLPGVDNEMADSIFEVVRDTISEQEQMLSIYIEDSDFSQINRNAIEKPWKVSGECFKLISSLFRYYQLTSGCFDPALGGIKEDVYDPEDHDLRELSGISLKDRIEMDYENSSVFFKNNAVKLDSGGFGKGYALDKIKNVILSFSIKNAFISFGDSSVLTIGKHPAGDFWKIGIRDLVDQRSNAWVFEINDGAVSTSGNNFINGKRVKERHIYNPHTGDFEHKQSVISVCGSSAFEGEIISTALFVADPATRIAIMKNFPQYKAIELVYSDKENKTIVSEIK